MFKENLKNILLCLSLGFSLRLLGNTFGLFWSHLLQDLFLFSLGLAVFWNKKKLAFSFSITNLILLLAIEQFAPPIWKNSIRALFIVLFVIFILFYKRQEKRA